MLVWTDQSGPTDHFLHGFHGEVVGNSPRVQYTSKYLWGLVGNIVVIGNQSGRELSVSMWISNPLWETAPALYNWIAGTLETLPGQFGYLTLDVDAQGYWPVSQQQVFNDLLFVGYDFVPFPGQDTPSPIKDEAGTLYRTGAYAGKLTWLIGANLRFLQTVPGRNITP